MYVIVQNYTAFVIRTSDRDVTAHKTRFYVSHNLELPNIFHTDRIEFPEFGRQLLSHYQSHGMQRLYPTLWGDLFHDRSSYPYFL